MMVVVFMICYEVSMSENSKSLENIGNVNNIGKIHLISWVMIFVIFLSKFLYLNWMHSLSFILVSISVFIYLSCFVWLFKRRKDPSANAVLKMTLFGFIPAIMFYSSIFLFGS